MWGIFIVEYGSGGQAAASVYVVKFNAIILATQTSATVTHDLGRIVKVNGVFCTDQVNPASDIAIINEGVSSFDVVFKSALAQETDTPVEGTYI